MVHDQQFCFKVKYKAWGCTRVREGGQTDRRKRARRKRREEKCHALEVILAGNSGNHGDLVNALQQERGTREKESRIASCCLGLSPITTLNMAATLHQDLWRRLRAQELHFLLPLPPFNSRNWKRQFPRRLLTVWTRCPPDLDRGGLRFGC